jgi:uncharacterized protein (DUF1330 family)
MSVYVIFSQEITDAEKYQEYAALAKLTVPKHGGKTIVRESNVNIIEGQPCPRIIIVEFESEAAALGWYNSPEYQEIIAMRLESTQGWMVIAPTLGV